MTNIIVQIVLFLAAWAVVVVRFRAMKWKDALKDNGIALKVWLMMVFSAIGLTSLLDFSVALDVYTLSNLSRLVAYGSFLTAINLGIVATLDAIGKSEAKLLIRRMWLLLVVTLLAVGVIYNYTLFLSWMPEFSYYQTPRSLPEALIKLVVHSFETIQGLTLSGILLAYLPSETSMLMRIRVVILMFCGLSVAGCSLLVITIAGGYFWPALISPILMNLLAILAAFTIILHLAAFLNNRIYAQFLILSRRIESWYAFQDLQYLMQRMTQIFPPIGLPPGNPNFLQFVLTPERYLYPAIILILDGRAMLNDFLAEVSDIIEQRENEERADWETEDDDLLGEALEVQRALQAVKTPDDFYEMVEVYRHASRDFLKTQRIMGRKPIVQ